MEEPRPASDPLLTLNDASLSYTGVTNKDTRNTELATTAEVTEKRKAWLLRRDGRSKRWTC
jgi:hypothetical protein